MFRTRYRLSVLLLLAGLVGTACRSSKPVETAPPEPVPPATDAMPAVIPFPAAITLDPQQQFVITSETVIYAEPGNDEARRIGHVFAGLLATTNAPPQPVQEAPAAGLPASHILLTTRNADPALGPEGYDLTITSEAVTVRATTPAGLFYGVQTLRHLLPPYVEYTAALPRSFTLPAGRITDRPRFAWRGAMLDVARHFRPVDDVKRYLDLMALYKLNRLHLHLADDQGWRIQIDAWPTLTTIGGSTEVGGGPGGFYTKADYAEIVRYAAERYITIVPEIDMPGHTNAALASIPELNCDGQAPPLYTGIKVGFSALCVEKDITYTFIDDVVREITALTPGPYFHFGGDEVETLSEEQYAGFVRRVQALIVQHGKQPIGWDEIAAVEAPPSAIVQWWRPGPTAEAIAAVAARGGKVIVSPADHLYLDMKYDTTIVLGLAWAGYISVEKTYRADPATLLPGVPESAILGIEAPLWAETTGTMDDVEYLAFPRLAGVAEIGWSLPEALDWNGYRERLGRQAPRWTALGVNFFRAPDVPWRP